ncbi:ScbA/BarX family gamma-butyrolactone biosynthesis protein [Streptomyces colonosanans]|uniref:A-factor biosynthesis protein n=1 Tax=Streptomyces colonosanans TaxID=1428652 RepID=A0A1S2PLQ1_9ACTN|nr:ScbA/BarX family gamma-butyrolactone biosynthesis protein [Streptomyces colonosanans]OIJ94653.1 A-factor biosynthesis protein [Streptomyces colonosanans]
MSWSRTVEREWVHRISVAEVLLTDVRSCGPLAFCAAAAWTRSHPTFPRGHDDRHSPWMVVETLRQLGIYIPLRHFDVPPTSRFLISDVSFRLDVAREPRAVHGASEITCLATVGGIRTGGCGNTVTGLRMQVDFLAGGRTFAHAAGGARFLDAERYQALRPGAVTTVAAGRGPRPQPAALGLESMSDVVVCLDGDRLLVDPADPRHPFFFDHGTDHVPGMALLEAARQAVALRSGGRLVRPVSCRMTASRFTEHTPPAVIHCSAYGHTGFFRMRQGGAQTAAGLLRYR